MSQALIAQALKSPIGDKAVLQAYQESPYLEVLNKLLQEIVQQINQELPKIADITTNLFGDIINHLDPLNFNRKVIAQISGPICIPQQCTHILGVTVKVPSVPICTTGTLSTGFHELKGLSTLRINDLHIYDVSTPTNEDIEANGCLDFYLDSLVAMGYAKTTGGPKQLAKPTSASTVAVINGLSPKANVVLTMSTKQMRLTDLVISEFRMPYQQLTINLNGIGPFNQLASTVKEELKAAIAPLFTQHGIIAKAVVHAVQTKIDKLIEKQDTMANYEEN
ncbi:hypothetical protein [Spartinivicinus poritis]|uniref:Uncharacterized protein n=1 Tax=Spartinivicinus poritis TaxID=2994640 RepID=A0ABT5UAD7_9GAMM|nr:hypothetical protein [Spartinivicinus sp. A2-2]MDE1463323.1 hypothetical protein [Spartinivicinus sp. A2-2]